MLSIQLNNSNKDGYYKSYKIEGMIFTREQLRFNSYPKDNLAMKDNLMFYTAKEEEKNHPSRILRNCVNTFYAGRRCGSSPSSDHCNACNST